MRAQEFRSLNDEQLRKRESELKEELFNLRFQQATGQLENTARIGLVKKDIARVKTIIRERELEIRKEA